MNLDNYFFTRVLIPIKNTKAIEEVKQQHFICKRIGNSYIDIKDGNVFTENNISGEPKVVEYVALSELYNNLGFKKKNTIENKEKAYKLFKKVKKNIR